MTSYLDETRPIALQRYRSAALRLEHELGVVAGSAADCLAFKNVELRTARAEAFEKDALNYDNITGLRCSEALREGIRN